MFGGLDWTLNASRGLSARAEFLVYIAHCYTTVAVCKFIAVSLLNCLSPLFAFIMYVSSYAFCCGIFVVFCLFVCHITVNKDEYKMPFTAPVFFLRDANKKYDGKEMPAYATIPAVDLPTDPMTWRARNIVLCMSQFVIFSSVAVALGRMRMPPVFVSPIACSNHAMSLICRHGLLSASATTA